MAASRDDRHRGLPKVLLNGHAPPGERDDHDPGRPAGNGYYARHGRANQDDLFPSHESAPSGMVRRPARHCPVPNSNTGLLPVRHIRSHPKHSRQAPNPALPVESARLPPGGGGATTTGSKATRPLGSTTHPAASPKPPAIAAKTHFRRLFIFMNGCFANRVPTRGRPKAPPATHLEARALQPSGRGLHSARPPEPGESWSFSREAPYRSVSWCR